ncbi:hypothetical protein CGLO_16195 [Colletotrichum gloeosporioides Cg-14]|uniref:Uncharacterized protein n=1 Tax=Colletotrichum gloeosporioides (strain Cg-14) TaxID=1237896 RepID=T0JP90_COLGC|nr:hypothetical protein CGLO_16195 [Colletotrichum gloeosporioides Cg-14]
MTITTPNNGGQLARWLNRKGDLCFEVAFFATAAFSFVAFGVVIIALSLVVGGLLVAGVVLFGAASMVGEKVNKVAPPVQSQAPTNETTKQRDTSKQEGAAKQIDVQKKDDVAQGNDDDTQNKDGLKKNRWKKQQKTNIMEEPGIVSHCIFCTALAFIDILVVNLALSALFYVGFYGKFGLIKGFRYLSNEMKERKAKTEDAEATAAVPSITSDGG